MSLPEEKTRRKFGNLILPEPGECRNPAGRPKGSRNKFSEAFFRDIAEDWQEGGKEAIRTTREQHPEVYLRVCAGLMSKEVDVRDPRFVDVSDDELRNALDAAIAHLIGMGFGRKARAFAEGGMETAIQVPALQ